jgi:hypothetical protein
MPRFDLRVDKEAVQTPSALRSVPFKMLVQVRKVRFHGRVSSSLLRRYDEPEILLKPLDLSHPCESGTPSALSTTSESDTPQK